MKDEVLIINKPSGITSHDVVDLVRKKTGIRRVGHAGTLDPLAEGVLIILLGKATKRQREFLEMDKEYLATIRLGATSDTDDGEGRIKNLELRIKNPPTTNEMKSALAHFVGKLEQVPPLYSAVKLKGKKAYELARKGEQPELKPKKVTMYQIKLLKYRWPYLEIKVRCSSGTYIRSLARDIGKVLGCGAYLEKLVRTRIGPYLLEDAQKIS